MSVVDLESFSLGYLAAIIDGEGSISLFTRNRGSYDDFLPYVEISNTEKEIIESARDMADVGEVYETPRKTEHKTIYRLCIRRQHDIVLLLERVKPFLMSKRKQRLAELLIEYCLIRLDAGHKAHTKREAEICEEVSVLNKRTGGDTYG